MEHASTQAALDYMKKLAGVSHDFELAEKLGYSKQALSSVKKRQNIPMKWFAKASLVFGVPVEELQFAGRGQKTANEDFGPQEMPPAKAMEEEQSLFTVERRLFEEDKRRFWEEHREIIAENRQLHREKEELLRQIGELREKVARLEERKRGYDRAHGLPAEDSDVV